MVVARRCPKCNQLIGDAESHSTGCGKSKEQREKDYKLFIANEFLKRKIEELKKEKEGENK